MSSLDWLRPSEFNEAPGECIVGAYWVPNEACEPNRIMVTCPFDPSHKMKQSKLAGHIVKCEKNFPGIKKVPCIYNALEFIDRDKVEEHHLVCPHKSDFVQSNPNQIPNVDHSLVQSHLTTWEDDGEVKDGPESTGPNKETDVVQYEKFPKSLRHFVGLENNTEALLDQGTTKSEETGVPLELEESNDESDLDKDESYSVYSEDGGNDAWSNSSVVGDVPLLESFNTYRAVFSDDEDIYVGESDDDDESSVHTENMNPSEQSEEQNRDKTESTASSNEINLYGSVDFSKNGDPVGNIAIHKINHAEELFKRSDRLKAKIANFYKLSIENSDDSNSQNMTRDGTNEANDVNGNVTYNNDHIVDYFEQSYEGDTVDGVDIVLEQGPSNTHEVNNQGNVTYKDESTLNSGDSQIRPENKSSSVLKIIDYTHDAPEQYRAKPRNPLTLSDLAVFPDEPEPCPYYVSKYDGLQTPYKVEDESEVFWKKVTGTYKGNPPYGGNSSTIDYETSSQSSDSSGFLQRDQLLQSLAKGRVDLSAYANTKQGHNRGMTAGRGFSVPSGNSNSSAHQDAFHSGGGRGNFVSKDTRSTRSPRGGNPGHRNNIPPLFRNQNASFDVLAPHHDRSGNSPSMRGRMIKPLNSRDSFDHQICMGRGQDFSDTNQKYVSKPGGNLEINFPQRNGRVTPNSNISKSNSPVSKSFVSAHCSGFNRHRGNQSALNRNEIPSFYAQIGREQDILRNNKHLSENSHPRSPRSYESNIHGSNPNKNESVSQGNLVQGANSPRHGNQGDFNSQGKGRGQILKSLIQARTSFQLNQTQNQPQNHHQGQNVQQKKHHQDQKHPELVYMQQNEGENNQHQGQSQNGPSPVVLHTPRGVTGTPTSVKRGIGRGALLQYMLEKNKQTFQS